MCKIKGYVINLIRDRHKLDLINNQPHFNEVFTVLDAIDGKKYRLIDLKDLFDYRKAFEVEGRPLGMGEICCSLSHNLAYKKIAADDSLSDDDFCLVAEDDIILIDGWYEKVKLIMEAVKDVPLVKVVSMQISNINNFDTFRYKVGRKFYPRPKVSNIIKVEGIDFELFQQYNIVNARGAAFYMIRKSEAIRLTKLHASRPDYLHADFWEFKLNNTQHILYTNPAFAYALEGKDDGLKGQRNIYSRTYKLILPLRFKLLNIYNYTIGRFYSAFCLKTIKKNLLKLKDKMNSKGI